MCWQYTWQCKTIILSPFLKMEMHDSSSPLGVERGGSFIYRCVSFGFFSFTPATQDPPPIFCMAACDMHAVHFYDIVSTKVGVFHVFHEWRKRSTRRRKRSSRRGAWRVRGRNARIRILSDYTQGPPHRGSCVFSQVWYTGREVEKSTKVLW